MMDVYILPLILCGWRNIGLGGLSQSKGASFTAGRPKPVHSVAQSDTRVVGLVIILPSDLDRGPRIARRFFLVLAIRGRRNRFASAGLVLFAVIFSVGGSASPQASRPARSCRARGSSLRRR